MATNTTNLELKKPAYSDTADISDINGNMDIIDTAVNAVENGMAIIANGNTHAAITSGQYVYIRKHGSLSEGLYKATQTIATNGTLSSSNVTAVSGGALNALNEQIGNLELVRNTEISIQYHSSSKMKLYRVGKVVFMSMVSDWASLPAGSSTEIGTIPNGYKPANDMYLNEASKGANGEAVRLLFHSNNGKIDVYNYGSAGNTNGCYTACWITYDNFPS